MAHELLGHGVSRKSNRGDLMRHEDAISMENLYLRAQGASYFRTGEQHGDEERSGKLSYYAATLVPIYAVIPDHLMDRIDPSAKAKRLRGLLHVIHPMDGTNIKARTGN